VQWDTTAARGIQMATSGLSEVVQHLRKVILLRDGAGLTDGQLLELFIANRDEAAFSALVRRHAPMVWGVCRRVLRNPQDAEDAFQSAFMVLVRKAGSVVPRHNVGNWLYGVAHQTALKARATIAKRKARESQVTAMPEQETADQNLWNNLQPLLDEELSRLPDKYRGPIVLCDLEGKTRKEAARQLRLPEGTVASRLARARTMLARRLARRGLAMPAGALAGLVAQQTASACVPQALVSSTIKATSLLAAGQVVAASAVSAKVVSLTEGVLKAMLLSKLKIVTALVLTAGIIAGGVGTSGVLFQTHVSGHTAVVATPASPQQQDTKKGVEKKLLKDVDWKEVEGAIHRLATKELKDVHARLMGNHADASKIRDCRICHNGAQEPLHSYGPAESLPDKINRLEREFQKERSEKELLQLEVWILLKELQRQNVQKKDG
jgi:RNA polymerase sigma factor (sigma-70 family)